MKLAIKGPKKSPYKNLDVHFKIDFQSLDFSNLAKSTYKETKIYHLNFYNDLEEIPFEKIYNSNYTFYRNIKNYFDFLYELFKSPNEDIWKDEEKFIMYKKYPDKYNMLASKKYNY